MVSEYVPLAVDIAAIVFIAVSIWLAVHQRPRWAICLSGLAVFGLTAMTVLRALPNPTRSALKTTVQELQRQLKTTTAQLELAKAQIIERERARTLTDKQTLERLLGITSGEVNALHYHLKRTSQTEWVRGMIGRYYLVTLLNPTTGRAFQFETGDHRLTGHESAFRASYAKFHNHVVSAIPANTPSQVFLRGGADSEPFVRTGNLGAEYGSISFRRLDDGQYGTKTDPAPFAPTLSNDDLPLLRAAYVRSIVSKRPTTQSGIELLHKKPSTLAWDQERKVDVILFVGQSSRSKTSHKKN